MLFENLALSFTIDKPSKKTEEEQLIKSCPFGYYNSQLFPDYQDFLKRKIESLKISEPIEETKEENLTDKIENKIKNKYNFLVPAISIEFKSGPDDGYEIEFVKEDLKKFFNSLGEIKHIEINGKVAYILYKYFFSALFAYDVVNEILSKESKPQLCVKMITREEEEAKLKKQKEKEESDKRAKFLSDDLLNGFFGLGGEEGDKQEMKSKKGDGKQAKQVLNGFGCNMPMAERNINYYPIFYNQMYANPTSAFPVVPPPQNPLNFKTASSRNYLVKFVCNYDIQIENDDKFMVTKRIIGNNGLILKKIIFDSCIRFQDYTTKVRLRGKGSGYKEGSNNTESEDPLQLCVSSLNMMTYRNCCRLIENFLFKLYYDYRFFCLKNQVSETTAIPVKTIVKYEFVVNRMAC